jgi:hypothetical protein
MIVIRRKSDGRYVREFSKTGRHKTAFSKYAARMYATESTALSALRRMGIVVSDYELVEIRTRREDV